MPAPQVLFDRFVVERVAGTGGMGTVYLARDSRDDRVVALKVLNGGDGSTVDRFEREARLLAELDHPGIVRYVAHGRGAEGRFLAMEWLDGEDLERVLARGPLSVGDTLTLGQRVADALAFAHARGVVHRDIKPSNLFLVGGDLADVRILDFGVARWREASLTATRAGSVLGTISYMAPEQARGEPDVDARADVFSLACVLFECLTGKPAFMADHAVAILAKILFEQAPHLADLCEGAPEALGDLLSRMLSKDAAARPADARSIAEALLAMEPLSAGALRPTAKAPAITVGERRLVSVVLLGPLGERMSGRPRTGGSVELTLAATLALEGVGHTLAAIRDVTRPWGAEPELLLDGSVVVLLRGDRRGRATEAGAASTRSLDLGAASTRSLDLGAASTRSWPSIELGAGSVRAPGHTLPPPSASTARDEVDSRAASPRGRAATDEAARAAACALALRAAVPGVPLALATGWAEVTGRLPIGEAIDRAAALLARALGGERGHSAHGSGDEGGGAARAGMGPDPHAAIHIDESTAALLDPTFETRASPSGTSLVGRRDDDGVRTLLGKPTPCVGRDVELSTLRALLEQSTGEPVARAALITGPAGVGKSRLRHELLRHARAMSEPPTIWTARGDSLRPGAAFDLLAQALRRTASILETDTAPLRQKKLLACVRRHLSGAHAEHVAELLGEVIGAGFDDVNSVKLRTARRDALVMGDQIRSAFCDLVAAECAGAPLVLVLEDLQWGDLPTVSLVDAALRLLPDAPFFVLATARPEVSEVFPALWAERDVRAISLGGLTRRAAEKLVRGALGDAADAALVARLVEQAGGNAFFLEELIRAVAEGKDERLPQTVLGMVEARLETMEPAARRVLRAASVFGEVFWEEGVAALLGAPVGRAESRRFCEELSRREIFVRRGEGRFANQIEHAFRHSLVRETAYLMLTEADRELGHRLAAEWLERAGEHDARTLAEHCSRGGDSARAATFYLRAAEQAEGGNDFRTAITCAVRGREHGASGEELGALLLVEARALMWLGDDVGRSLEAALSAMDLLAWGEVPWCLAAANAANMAVRVGREADLLAVSKRIAEVLRLDLAAPTAASSLRSTRVAAGAVAGARLLVAGKYDDAEDLLSAAERAARSIDAIEPTARARLVAVRAWQALVRGDPSAFLELATSAVALFEESGDRRSACNQRMNVGYAYNEVGAYADAERELSETLRVAEELGLRSVMGSAKHNLGWSIGRTGRLAEGCAMQLAAAQVFHEGGDLRMEGACRMYAAALLAEDGAATGGAGALARALVEARAALELLAAVPPLRAGALSVLARVHLAAGAPAAALAAAREAKQAMDALGHIEEGEARIRLVLAEALHAAGHAGAAREAIHTARERLLARAAKIGEPRFQASFLRNVPENARTLELAAAWCEAVPA